jgi:hypothetical protein
MVMTPAIKVFASKFVMIGLYIDTPSVYKRMSHLCHNFDVSLDTSKFVPMFILYTFVNIDVKQALNDG